MNQRKNDFLTKLINGGKITGSGSLSTETISQAQSDGNFYSDVLGYGYVYFPPTTSITGIEWIQKERMEQINKHGRTVALDIERNNNGQLISAVQILIEPKLHDQIEIYLEAITPRGWDKKIWVKMCKKPFADRLVIAGALIAAQIDVELASYNSD